MVIYLRHRIIPAFRKRITPQDPPHRQQESLKRTVSLYGFYPISGAAGEIWTLTDLHRRYIYLITSDQTDQ